MIGVLEDGDNLINALNRCLKKAATSDCEIAEVYKWDGQMMDIAVMMKAPDRIVSAKVLVCPSKNAVDIARCGRFDQIVTVGYKDYDTVTLSASGDSTLSVCFQREITPLVGFTPPIGEVIATSTGTDELTMLMCAVMRCVGIV